MPPAPGGAIPGLDEGRAMADSGNQQAEGDSDPPPARLVRVGLYFYAALMGVALVWRMGGYGEPIFFASELERSAGVNPVRDFGVGLLAGAGVLAASSVWTAYSRWGDSLARELAAAIGPLGLPNALLLAFASGFAEELFFRGALQPRVGLLAASLLFACVHFVPRRALLPWAGFALIAGLILGGLFVWSGNLIAPITAHIMVNAVSLPLLARRFESENW